MQDALYPEKANRARFAYQERRESVGRADFKLLIPNLLGTECGLGIEPASVPANSHSVLKGGGKMSKLERTVLAELRKVHETEAALEGMYRTLSSSADSGRFLASLRSLDERVSRLESLLESAA